MVRTLKGIVERIEEGIELRLLDGGDDVLTGHSRATVLLADVVRTR